MAFLPLFRTATLVRCWINQQVTIGYNDKGKAGAKVIGDGIIGDDVIIGANALVVKDVPFH